MKDLCFNYLYELYDHTSVVCVDLELELADNECVGEHRISVEENLKEHTKRKNELWDCLKFLKG